MKKEPYAVIVISDSQVPWHDPRSFAAVEAYMASRRWDEIIYIGDFIDFDQISRFNVGKPLKTSRPLADDFAIANEILDRHDAILRKLNPHYKLTWLQGNHEAREDNWLDINPAVRGLMSVEKGLRLKERNANIIRCYPDGDVYELGNAIFLHGIYVGPSAMKKTAERFRKPVFTGHTHSVHRLSLPTFGDGPPIYAQSLGCLCEYTQEYIGKNPSDWEQAFGIFFFLPDGSFTYYVPILTDHGFVGPDGVHYRG